MDEPIADASRAILDGHMVLSRRLASRGHYPPIDVMESVSRVMKDIASEAHWDRSIEVKSMMAAYSEAEDLINIGAYARGSNPNIDKSLQFVDPINNYLRQGLERSSPSEGFDHNVRQLMGIMAEPIAKAGT